MASIGAFVSMIASRTMNVSMRVSVSVVIVVIVVVIAVGTVDVRLVLRFSTDRDVYEEP